jgi:hypothetical protein
MMPSAVGRACAGKVSATSAAPAANSPPIPSPTKKRRIANCSQVCASALSPVKPAYISTVIIIVRVRPSLSPIMPNKKPPVAQPAIKIICTSPEVRATSSRVAPAPSSSVIAG